MEPTNEEIRKALEAVAEAAQAVAAEWIGMDFFWERGPKTALVKALNDLAVARMGTTDQPTASKE